MSSKKSRTEALFVGECQRHQLIWISFAGCGASDRDGVIPPSEDGVPLFQAI